MSLEYKSINIDCIEFKFDDAKPGFFSGYASKFNSVDSYGDTILPGAYKDTLKKRFRPVQLRYQHYGPIIGKLTKMLEDDIGLYVEGELTPNHSLANDVHASLKHGAIDGLSIGFSIPLGGSKDGDTTGTRIIKKIDLYEISIVESPADLGAKIGDVKSSMGAIKSIRELENFLQSQFYFSRSTAKSFIYNFKSIISRDAEKSSSDVVDEIKSSFNNFKI